MKLMLCNLCLDIVKLHTSERHCNCATCFGKYEEDGITVQVRPKKHVIMLGFDNNSFVTAIQRDRANRMLGKTKELGERETFDAFIIPQGVETVKFIS